MSHSQLFWLHAPISLLLPALASWYVGYNLAGTRPRSSRRVMAVIASMALVGLGCSIALIFWSEQDRAPIRGLVTAGFYLVGWLSTAGALLLLRDAVRAVFGIARRIRRTTRRSAEHGRALEQWVPWSTWLCVAAALVSVVLGRSVASRAPEVKRLEVPIVNLPHSFTGYRIVHLTDLHIHGELDRDRIRNLVLRVNDLNPDLIAITGDVVDGPMNDLRVAISDLGGLRARDGVAMVVGNHEYYADVDACVAEFRRLGFRVLLNEHELIERGGARLVVAGVPNPSSGMHGARYAASQGPIAHLPSSPATAARGMPNDAPRLLLAHQPKSVAEARGLGFDLALAGHTHGGQFFPWTLAARFVFPYAEGVYRDGPMTVYVGRGIGTFGPPLRLGAPPELALIELRHCRRNGHSGGRCHWTSHVLPNSP